MSKRMRDQFEKRPRDYFDTPETAIKPLLRELKGQSLMFSEPCAGANALVRVMEEAGHICVEATDVEPRATGVEKLDALTYEPMATVVTNPPFSKWMLEPLVKHWLTCTDAWLLVPLDLLANLWFAPYAPHVHKIVPIGRVVWVAGSRTSGFENYAWVSLKPKKANFVAERQRAA